MLRICKIEKQEDIKIVRQLFVEYADSLGFDLGFQNFEEELANLPGAYAPPTGCLILAMYKDQPAGCVALRKLSKGICEGKRLYVKPEFRGLGIGRKLVEAIITEAQRFGYSCIRGDTVPSMQAAQALYKSLGFKDIEPYCHNPIEGARFIELKLSKTDGICMQEFKTSDLRVIKRLIDKTIDVCYRGFYNAEAIAFFKEHHCDNNIIKDAKEGYTIIMEKESLIIGTGTIHGDEIKRVFVDPVMQNCGYGKEIMRYLEAKAIENGIMAVKLDASLPAKKFYDSMGYKTLEGTYLEVGNGKRLDYYKMEKALKGENIKWDNPE